MGAQEGEGMKLKLPIRVWILIAVVLLAVIAIKPAPYATGVQVKTVEVGSDAAAAGLASGQIVHSVNGEPILTVADFNNVMRQLEVEPKQVEIGADNESFKYNVTSDIGFNIDENLTVTSVTEAPLDMDMVVQSLNGVEVGNITDYNRILDELLPKQIIKIDTNKGQIAFLTYGAPKVTVGEASKSNLRKGLDLEGGTRVLLKPVSETGEVTEKDIGDIIQVLSNRLNVYGLSDLRIRSSVDWQGEAFILIEIAGATKEEVKDLISQQGKFEARIANETVFVGGKNDIAFVCRDDGSCSGIRSCGETSGGQYACRFEFVIHITPEAAQRHANSTKDLDVVVGEDGHEVLSENIDFYLDDKMVDSLRIGADLKGSETTSIAISGSGVGANRNAAIETSVNNMNKLQTILITGSLPFDLEIAKLDSISPLLGKRFVKNSLLVGLMAMLAVAVVVFIRYRSLKVLLPMVLTSASELVIILGFASLIEWNLDMAAIAGIIAAIGTGVDDQIVILDEVIKGQARFTNWRQRIKRAFFIIFAAYATTVAAMVPLWNAGAGLIRGFAITIIVGVTIGVFLTRPAFAAIVEKLFKE